MRCYAMLYYAMLYSGLHTCEDVYCVTCGVMVGWEYVRHRIVSSLLVGVLFNGWIQAATGMVRKSLAESLPVHMVIIH